MLMMKQPMHYQEKMNPPRPRFSKLFDQWRLMSMQDIKDRVIGKGFTIQQLEDCMFEYDGVGLWQVIDNGETLMFTNAAGDEEREEGEGDVDDEMRD